MDAGAAVPIRTPDQRLRVFVSSTLEELAPERAAARASIERLRLIPVMFELGARPHPPAQLYRAYLDQSDVFIGVYWQRYGWIAPDASVSGLEDEFALSAGMPRLLYIKEPSNEREARLADMILRFDDNLDSSYRFFSAPDELGELVEADLAILLAERFEASRPDRRAESAERALPARSAPPPLPDPLTPTVGREGEVASVAALIRSGSRLVTLTGTGGVGKTRVASEVAGELLGDFDEVRFVRVGDVVDPTLVTATIASAIGVPVELNQAALEAVAAGIGADRVLLVLDNVEQVVSAGPELVTLLGRCPGLSLLVTSRHVLRLRGEHEHPLAPLEVPANAVGPARDRLVDVAAVPAVALFVECATAARPTFGLDAGNAEAVAEICRRLDGLPLAIELVAAHTRLLSPCSLLDRLGDRIDLLAGGCADLPDRQRALRTTLDWSHRLLNAPEQALFARLAVFTGGASLEAVEAVCGGGPVGDVLGTLSSLLEKSLVVTVDEEGVDAPRVAMLQTVRIYAWEQLEGRDELDDVRDRHAAWFLDLVRSCDPAHQPRATARWAELDRELPNVRAAIALRTEQDDDEALGLFAASMWIWYWLAGRMSEGRAWIESLEARAEMLEDADGVVAACFWEALGAVRFSLGDHEGAELLLRRALDGYGAAGDDEGSSIVACMLAVIVPMHGSHAEAVELATAAVAGGRSLGVDWGLAFALAVLGGAVRRHDSAERGFALQREALEIARRVDEPVLLGQILAQIAIGLVCEGDLAGAGSCLAEAAGCCRRTLQREGTVFCLEVGAALAFADERARDAAVLVGAADELRERVDIAVWPVMQARRAALVCGLAESLGADDYTAALADGRRSDPFVLLGV